MNSTNIILFIAAFFGLLFTGLWLYGFYIIYKLFNKWFKDDDSYKSE